MSERTIGLQAPALPQVNLLPPEIRSARTLSVVKRWLGIAILLSFTVAALGYGYAVLEERAAHADLDLANATTNDLLAEQARYADVPLVLGQLATIEDARRLGMSTEILWSDYLGAIAVVTPEGVTLESLSYTGASPSVLPTLSANALFGPAAGVITFSGRAPTIPDTAAWMDVLDSIPGLRDAWITVDLIGAGTTQSYYLMTSSVQVDASAYANRFVQTGDEEGED